MDLWFSAIGILSFPLLSKANKPQSMLLVIFFMTLWSTTFWILLHNRLTFQWYYDWTLVQRSHPGDWDSGRTTYKWLPPCSVCHVFLWDKFPFLSILPQLKISSLLPTPCLSLLSYHPHFGKSIFLHSNICLTIKIYQLHLYIRNTKRFDYKHTVISMIFIQTHILVWMHRATHHYITQNALNCVCYNLTLI